jgi:DNA-directed RNA polymerase subunit M/transcription elongation factor TFIIS
MSIFCNICNNLLTVITTNDDLYFKCTSCNKKFDYEPVDTLRYEEVIGTSLLMYKTILQHAGKDPVNPKVRKACINQKCDSTIVKQVRHEGDMRLINICIDCNEQWLNVD